MTPDANEELLLLRSRLAAMEQLLEVHERTVVEQSERLDRALAGLRAEAEAAEAARAAAAYAAERSRFVAAAGVTLAQSLDYEVTLQSVARLAVPDMADWCVVDLVADTGSLRRLVVAHSDPEKVALVQRLRERYPDKADAETGVHAVIRSGVPQLVRDIPHEMLAAAAHDDDHLRILESLELRSLIIVPLSARGVTHGALTLALSGNERRYGDEDLEIARELAMRAALAIDNARLVADHESAQQHLEQTASELEAQTEELQVTVEELEATTEDLLQTNEQLDKARIEAEQARTAAEEANAAKSQFLATMSHELRTPLNAIDGYAELLQLGIHGPVAPKQHEALERIRRAQKRLLSLINDVLNFAKIEAGQVTFTPRDVTVAELLTDIENVMTPQVRSRDQTLLIDVPEPDLSVFTDPDKTQQILLNLLANAVKFTQRGGRIAVAAVRHGAEAVFRVSDNGPGIPPDRLESIFDPFVQVGAGFTRDAGGVGLGLSISRDLARSMSGELTGHSALGAGATFTLRLPLSNGSQPRQDTSGPSR